MSDRPDDGDLDFPLPPTGPGSGNGGSGNGGSGDDPPEITLREDDPPAADDGEEEFYDGSTFGLGPVTELPDLHPPAPLPPRAAKGDAAKPPRMKKAAKPAPADDSDANVPAGGGPSAPPTKPRLRDWLEQRCRKEAKMYTLAAALLAPVALAATGLTWLVLKVALPGDGWVAGLLAAAVTGGLFWLERVTREDRSVTLRVEPEDRDVEPVALELPRGTGLTWLMYLAGSRDHPGFVRFVLGVGLFGPRLCELVFKMGRTAKLLWGFDVDALAGPVKTLVKAEGKVAFGAFLEAHRRPAPQALVDRLALIDGVLFLPTSNPPGLCTSGAMKDEFAAWRENWREQRRDGRLYD